MGDNLDRVPVKVDWYMPFIVSCLHSDNDLVCSPSTWLMEPYVCDRNNQTVSFFKLILGGLDASEVWCVYKMYCIGNTPILMCCSLRMEIP